MTRDQFKEILDKKGYKWKEEGEWIIVSGEQYNVNLNYLKSIPDNVKFTSKGFVFLGSLESIPDNLRFTNRCSPQLNSLKSIPANLDLEEILNGCNDIKINGKWLDLNRNIEFPDSRWKTVDGRVQMYESWVKNNY